MVVTGAPTPAALLPPRTSAGALGWARANLFNTWYNGLLTFASGMTLVLALWFGLGWVFGDADWNVVATLGGHFIIGQYNTEAACPGQDCFWRPQVALLLVTTLLGVIWCFTGSGVARAIAILAATTMAAFAFLPYSLEEMGLDVRLLLLANLPALATGWALARYTRLGKAYWAAILGVVAFLLTLVLLRGLPGVPGMQPVSVIYWGGLMLNLMLAVSGIALSLPIGVALALGRRSRLPLVKLLCVLFTEVFRGVPLITLLFMSQVLVPLAFPEDFPLNSVARAAIVITLFSSAYMAENVRGGLQALHPGQTEAAQALGLPSSPSEDYLTVLASQRQWIATTNCVGCPSRPPDSFANSAVLTTSAKFLMRWAGPSARAFLCRLTPKRNSLSRLWPVQISDHSPFTFSSPRSRNCRNPRPCLIWPNTGSTVCIREA